MDYLENDGETGASSMRGASPFHSSLSDNARSAKEESPLIKALSEHFDKYYPPQKPAQESDAG